MKADAPGGFILKLLSILQDRNGGLPVSTDHLVDFLRRMAKEGLDPFTVDENGPCGEFWRELGDLYHAGYTDTTDVTGSGASTEAKIGLTGLGRALCVFLELPSFEANVIDELTNANIEGFKMGA